MQIFPFEFEEDAPRLMVLEGHQFTNDPDDLGGPTKFGISTLAYPDIDIEHLTWLGAKGLYYRDYWQPARCAEIKNPDIRFQLFESAVHMDPPFQASGRPRRSIKIAQYALLLFGESITVDGKIGPQTIGLLNSYPHQEALFWHMQCLQYVALLIGSGNEEEVVALVRERLPQLKKYLRGWMRRIAPI